MSLPWVTSPLAVVLAFIRYLPLLTFLMRYAPAAGASGVMIHRWLFRPENFH